MDRPSTPPMEIRDPIHGAIPVDSAETEVIDHPFVQRLRGIRQLGFSHLPFPGATHTRYCHSLGVMHLAGRAFDACFRDDPFANDGARRAYRHCVRLAALCHDLGHAPFSHSAEFAMPPVGDLSIQAYAAGSGSAEASRRASHEDYTIAILTKTALGDTIRENFGFEPEHVAALISPDVVVDDQFFLHKGFDLRGLLSQIISSDLDVDRLDYLVRDSFFTGAQYGQIDTNWLVSNMARHVDEKGRVCLALDRRALYAFDDFMIARFHMFVMVYFHQKSVAYDELLKRYMQSDDCGYRLPADLDQYHRTDDAELMAHLRSSTNQWACRIVEYRPFKVVWERQREGSDADLKACVQRLSDAGIDTIDVPGHGVVYGERKPGIPPIYVVDRQRNPGSVVRMDEATGIFERYQDERCLGRIYVAGEERERAYQVLEGT